MSKFTPGPWTYQERSDAYTHIVRGPSDRLICQLEQDTSGVAEATARVIAAAPELYAAAKMLEDLMNNWGSDFRIETKDIGATMHAGSMIEKFREAIAKVENLDRNLDKVSRNVPIAENTDSEQGGKNG